MFPLRTVLCPVDLSEASKAPLHQAAALAALDHARFIVLLVIDALLAAAAKDTPDLDRLTRDSRSDLEQFVQSVGMAGPMPELTVSVGRPAEEILKTSRNADADLVVMGTHGFTGYRKFIFGSTTEQVLRDTMVPALVVPPSGTEILSIEMTGPWFHVGHVLAPVDLEQFAPAHVETAAEVAARFKAPLTVLYVVPRPPVMARLAEWLDQQPVAHGAEPHARLRALVADLKLGGQIRTMIRVGNPAEDIVGAATGLNAGLIVMGLRKPGAPSGARPGSIAYRVLSMALSIVLALPPDGTA